MAAMAASIPQHMAVGGGNEASEYRARVSSAMSPAQLATAQKLFHSESGLQQRRKPKETTLIRDAYYVILRLRLLYGIFVHFVFMACTPMALVNACFFSVFLPEDYLPRDGTWAARFAVYVPSIPIVMLASCLVLEKMAAMFIDVLREPIMPYHRLRIVVVYWFVVKLGNPPKLQLSDAVAQATAVTQVAARWRQLAAQHRPSQSSTSPPPLTAVPSQKSQAMSASPGGSFGALTSSSSLSAVASSSSFGGAAAQGHSTVEMRTISSSSAESGAAGESSSAATGGAGPVTESTSGAAPVGPSVVANPMVAGPVGAPGAGAREWGSTHTAATPNPIADASMHSPPPDAEEAAQAEEEAQAEGTYPKASVMLWVDTFMVVTVDVIPLLWGLGAGFIEGGFSFFLAEYIAALLYVVLGHACLYVIGDFLVNYSQRANQLRQLLATSPHFRQPEPTTVIMMGSSLSRYVSFVVAQQAQSYGFTSVYAQIKGRLQKQQWTMPEKRSRTSSVAEREWQLEKGLDSSLGSTLDEPSPGGWNYRYEKFKSNVNKVPGPLRRAGTLLAAPLVWLVAAGYAAVLLLQRGLDHLQRLPTWQLALLSLLLYISMVAVVLVTPFGWLVLMLSLIAIAHTLRQRYPDFVSPFFMGFLTWYAITTGVMIASSATMATEHSTEKLPDLAPFTAVHGSALTSPVPPPHAMQGCQLHWHGLDMLDMSLLNNLVYETDPHRVQNVLNHTFPLGMFEVQDSGGPGDPRHDQVIRYLKLYQPERNETLFLIRGTVTMTDVMQDFDMYTAVKWLQIVSKFINVISVLPARFQQDWIKSMAFGPLSPEPLYVDMVKKVRQTVDEEYFGDTSKVIVSGHSLGGALSKVIGVNAGVDVVAFSGPGVVYSRTRYGLLHRQVDQQIFNIVPHHDPVPEVDLQGGLVQYLECTEAFPLNCHKLATFICRILKNCGDHRRRIISPQWLADEVDNLPDFCQAIPNIAQADTNALQPPPPPG